MKNKIIKTFGKVSEVKEVTDFNALFVFFYFYNPLTNQRTCSSLTELGSNWCQIIPAIQSDII